MRIGAVFSQADSGTDPDAIRQWGLDAEAAGFEHLMAYDHILGASVERLGAGPFGSFPKPPYTSEHTFHEILVLFSHLAALTTKMSFRFHHLRGVGINPLPTHPLPIVIGSGASDAVLRRVVRKADGWLPLLIPGLDAVNIGTAVAKLRQFCDEAGRNPATLPIHGRVYGGPGWQAALEQTLELGFPDCSIGFNRLAQLGLSHAEHLRAVIDAKPEIDKLLG